MVIVSAKFGLNIFYIDWYVYVYMWTFKYHSTCGGEGQRMIFRGQFFPREWAQDVRIGGQVPLPRVVSLALSLASKDKGMSALQAPVAEITSLWDLLAHNILTAEVCLSRLWERTFWVRPGPDHGPPRSCHGDDSRFEKGGHHQYCQWSHHLLSRHPAYGGAPSGGQKLLGGHRFWVSSTLLFDISWGSAYFSEAPHQSIRP